MEGLNKVFTSELQTYVSELKEVMFQKGYSDCQVQTYNKTWQSILSYASVQPNQEFTEGFSSTIPSGCMCRSFRKT